MKKILLLLAIPLYAQDPLGLSMKKAVELALSPDGNARMQLIRESAQAAIARKDFAKGALLPNLDASVSEQDFTRNLKAFGVSIPIPIPGYVSPSVVGPLSNFDMRMTFSQSIFDFSAWKRLDAAKTGLKIAEADKEATSSQVADAVAKAYLVALRTKAAVDAVQANLKLAERLAKLAIDQKDAGTGTGIEVVRAQVQQANEKQKLLIAELQYEEREQKELRNDTAAHAIFKLAPLTQASQACCGHYVLQCMSPQRQRTQRPSVEHDSGRLS